MAVGVVATFNDSFHSPGFDITVSGLSGFDTLTVERIDLTGEDPDTPVRGADKVAVTGSTFAAADYEAPVGKHIVYRATASSKTFTDDFARTVTAWGSPLNANPYFETNASNWSKLGGTVARSTAQFHEGAASLLFTPDGVTANVDARTENVPVAAGQPYRASAWVYSAVARDVAVNINWRNSGGGFVALSTTTMALAATTWTLLEVAGVAPALTASALLTVSMGGTPPASHTLHIDEATLSPEAGGWGTATSGLVWLSDGAAASQFTVANEGRHIVNALNTTYRSTISGLSISDVNIKVSSLIIPAIVGNYARSEVYLRYKDSLNFYSVLVHRQVSGAVDLQLLRVVGGVGTVLTAVPSGITHSPGVSLVIRAEMVGVQLKAKVWRGDGVEPAGWQISTSDSTHTKGSIGIGSLLPPGNTNTLPLTIAYDDLIVVGPGNSTVFNAAGTSSEIGVQDSFLRVATNGWGPPDIGAPWVVRDGVVGDYSATASIGRMSISTRTSTPTNSFGNQYRIASPLTHTDVDVVARFRPQFTPVSDGLRLSLTARETATGWWELEANCQTSNAVSVRFSRWSGTTATATTSITVPGLTWAVGSWYWIRFQVVGTQLRGKVWADGSTEPAGWIITHTDNLNALPTGQYVGAKVFSSVFRTNPLPEVVEWDDFWATLLDLDTVIPYTDPGSTWLKSVGQPAISRRVNVSGWTETSRPGRVLGEYNVLGRQKKVILTDVLGGREGTLALATYRVGAVWENDSSYRDLETLLQLGGTMLVQTTGVDNTGEADMYLEITGVKRSRVGVVGGDFAHLFEVSFIEVDRPASTQESLTLRDWQDVLDQSFTWQNVLDSYTTWLDVLQRDL